MSLEDELSEDLAKHFQVTQDFEVMASLLEQEGWASVWVKHGDEHSKWVDAKRWVDENCTGHHQEHLGHWIFEKPEEATWFKLKFA